LGQQKLLLRRNLCTRQILSSLCNHKVLCKCSNILDFRFHSIARQSKLDLLQDILCIASNLSNLHNRSLKEYSWYSMDLLQNNERILWLVLLFHNP
jgi:hypothetical protein